MKRSTLVRLAAGCALLLAGSPGAAQSGSITGKAHNVYSPDGEAFNLGTFKPNEDRNHTFAEEGAYTQLCSIHPEMLAFIYVAPSPHAAAVDAKGSYVIKDVPPGDRKSVV